MREATPTPTETDRRRLRAASALNAQIRRMTALARQFRSRLVAHRNGTATLASLEHLACEIARTISNLEETARRGNIPPGIVRELREQNGFDGPSWNELYRLSYQQCGSR